MADAANLGFTLLKGGQAKKHVTVNEALTALDAAHGGETAISAVDAASGAATGDRVLVEDVPVTGASVSTVIQIPNRARVEAVSVVVVEDVTGATSFKVGDAGSDNRFGDLLGVSAGSSNVGVISGLAYYAAESVILTANGGSFTGGTVRVAIHCRVYTAPGVA